MILLIGSSCIFSNVCRIDGVGRADRMTEKTIWGIHMRSDHGEAYIEQSYVVVEWHETGDLAKIAPTRDAFKAAYQQV